MQIHNYLIRNIKFSKLYHGILAGTECSWEINFLSRFVEDKM